jgi:hypothetical protein
MSLSQQAPAASPPPAAAAGALAEQPAPASSPATTAATGAPAAAPVPATAATAAATAPREYDSYVVLKGGWFGSADDYQGQSFEGAGEWEIAVGTGRTFGFEIGSGSMTTSAGGLEVRTIPLLVTLRLQVPIAFVAPHLDLGAGVYFTHATIADASFDATTLGWHAALGCDVLLGRLIVGADFRYMGIAPTFGTIGTVTLDRYALLLKAGVRF